MSHQTHSFIFLFLLCATSPVEAWDNHALPSAITLLQMKEVSESQEVKAESLEEFLRAEQGLLVRLLIDEEVWAVKNLDEYQARPKEHAFKNDSDSKDLRSRFMRAMRFNPNSRFVLYTQDLPGVAVASGEMLKPEMVSTLPNSLPTLGGKFRKLRAGQGVSPVSVFSSAADEPDYGLDIGLFSNNNTDYGKTYGFGLQPYGKNELEYSSQAPLHMGFYHEWGLLEFLASHLMGPLVEYRIHQFYTLAKFAFEQGHAYWGWRFAGMGAHYIQDMTQPYHAAVLPGEWTLALLGSGLLEQIGFEGPRNDFSNQAKDEHTAFEKYVVCSLTNELELKDNPTPMLDSLRKGRRNTNYTYSNVYIREVLAKESNDLACSTADALKSYVSSGTWKSPGCQFSKGEREPIFEQLMQNFAVHTRSWIGSVR